MDAVPFGRGWFRTIRPDESVELLGESGGLIKRMDGINTNWIARDGSLFTRYVSSSDAYKITKVGDVITTFLQVYNANATPIGVIEQRIVVGSCQGFATDPPRAAVECRFGPNGCFYHMKTCSGGVTITRWCP